MKSKILEVSQDKNVVEFVKGLRPSIESPLLEAACAVVKHVGRKNVVNIVEARMFEYYRQIKITIQKTNLTTESYYVFSFLTDAKLCAFEIAKRAIEKEMYEREILYTPANFLERAIYHYIINDYVSFLSIDRKERIVEFKFLKYYLYKIS